MSGIPLIIAFITCTHLRTANLIGSASNMNLFSCRSKKKTKPKGVK